MNPSASDILSLLRALINALSSTYNFYCIFVYDGTFSVEQLNA